MIVKALILIITVITLVSIIVLMFYLNYKHNEKKDISANKKSFLRKLLLPPE